MLVDIETLRAFELAPGIVREDIAGRRITNGWVGQKWPVGVAELKVPTRTT